MRVRLLFLTGFTQVLNFVGLYSPEVQYRTHPLLVSESLWTKGPYSYFVEVQVVPT